MSEEELSRELDNFKASFKSVKRKLYHPSYTKELESLKQLISIVGADKAFMNHPLRGIPRKLRMYEFAASHGVSIPKIFAVWSSPKKIESLENLPKKFVLKSDGGSSARGVLALKKEEDGMFLSMDGQMRLNEAEVISFFSEAYRKGQAYGPIFAEEFLEQDDGEIIPDDLKFYMAYGEIMQVLVRRVDKLNGLDQSVRSAYFGENGENLGKVNPSVNIDEGLTLPDNFGEVSETARHLSKAMGLPFCRVDLYRVNRGIVFGEITRAPGGTQTYIEEHNQAMGEQWLQAKARLTMDQLEGRPTGLIWGQEKTLNLYPVTDEYSRVYRSMTSLPCRRWCY